MAFRGWPVEAVEFFEELEADNSKTYWLTHRHVYDECVLHPMEELLDELVGEFGEGRIFRPYRDVRFSADKSPYKTSIAATLSLGGYVHLSAHELGVGAGFYHMAPDQLDRYRRAVDDDGAGSELAGIVASAAKAGIGIAGHEELKTAPKGYPREHPRIDLLRHKGLVAWQQWSVGAWLGTRRAKERIVGVLRAARPLIGWLERNVGSSAIAEPARR